MKEKVILIIVIIFMVVLVGGASFVMNKTIDIDENLKQSGDMDISNIDKPNEIISGENNVEVTINYVTDENFENEVLKSEKTVLIDFYADWCGPCKVLAPILQEYANENPNVKVVKMNVDENQETSANYSVYSIPTLVVIKDGVETNRIVGVNSKENIKKAVEFVKE